MIILKKIVTEKDCASFEACKDVCERLKGSGYEVTTDHGSVWIERYYPNGQTKKFWSQKLFYENGETLHVYPAFTLDEIGDRKLFNLTNK